MPVRVFFALSSGLGAPVHVPKGTLSQIHTHIEFVELTLGLQPVQHGSNPPRWPHKDRVSPPKAERLTDEEYCTVVYSHNAWIRRMYRQFGEWYRSPVEDGEVIRPEDAQTFWQGFTELEVPVHRWSSDYFVKQMEHMYEVLRGRESEGVTLGADALTPKQAGAVIRLMESYLDPDDHRLEVCRGHDHLTSTEDGYMWCGQCGDAVHADDFDQCLVECSNTRCPLLDYVDDEEAGQHLYTQTQVRITQTGSPWHWDRQWDDLDEAERSLWIKHSQSLRRSSP